MSCLVSHLPLTGATTERFSPYAVETRTGPHVTIQAGVLHAGRFWTTTSRDSLKARSVRAHSFAATVVRDGDDGQRVIAGSTIALDATRPLDALSDPFSSLFAAGAVLRLGSEQVAQILGYLESASQIPSGWLPHKRVLLVTDIDRSLRLRGDDLIEATGRWDRTANPLLADPDATPAPLPENALDRDTRDLLDDDHPVRLGIGTPDGPIALPATWGADGVVVSADALGVVRAALPGPACITVDDSTSRRPDRKRGVMFRGAASILSIEGDRAEIGLRAERITTWDGFEASTIDVEGEAAPTTSSSTDSS